MESLMYRDMNEEIRVRASSWYKNNIDDPYGTMESRQKYFSWLEQQGLVCPNDGAPYFKNEASKTLFLLRWT